MPTTSAGSGLTERPAISARSFVLSNPKVVIQPWTEDPRAAKNAKRATTDLPRSRKSFIAGLAAMHAVADAVVALTRRPPAWMGVQLAKELRFLGMDNIKNRSAVENLIAMGKGREARGRSGYAMGRTPGSRACCLASGCVFGPPSLEQSEKIRKQRTKDVDQFWHLLAGQFRLQAGAPLAKGLDRRRRSGRGTPPEARWFRDRLQRLRGTQLLEIVRSLDAQMNNTSVILLFEVGGKNLLFARRRADRELELRFGGCSRSRSDARAPRRCRSLQSWPPRQSQRHAQEAAVGRLQEAWLA